MTSIIRVGMYNAWSLSLVLAVTLTAVCHRHLWRITHFSQPVILSTSQPFAEVGQYTVKLISIAEDGTTQIEVLQTHRTLSARPSEYFLSSEFGNRGLSLDSASRAIGTAKFGRHGVRYD